eukprot:3968856-Pyramimonas_sp.AAC.1
MIFTIALFTTAYVWVFRQANVDSYDGHGEYKNVLRLRYCQLIMGKRNTGGTRVMILSGHGGIDYVLRLCLLEHMQPLHQPPDLR